MQLFGHRTSLAGSIHHHKQTHSACCQAVGVILLSRSSNSCKGRNVQGQYESADSCDSAEDLFSVPVHLTRTPMQKQICSLTCKRLVQLKKSLQIKTDIINHKCDPPEK